MAILPQNAGTRLGWLGYGYQDPMPKYHINLVGYPGDQPSFTMWHSFCPLEQIRERQLLYKCGQWPGDSGGPVFVFSDVVMLCAVSRCSMSDRQT